MSDVKIDRNDWVEGIELAGRVWGAGNPTRVLALHGWLDNAASFERLAPLLPELHVAAIDLPGHGLSEHRGPGASYDFLHWIPTVLDAAAVLGWDKYSLVGHSLGGSIAAFVAAVAPERVERLVLLDAIGPYSAELDAAPARLATAVTHRNKRAKLPQRVYADREAARCALMLANTALSPDAADLLVQRGVRGVENGVVWRYDPRLRNQSIQSLTEVQIRAFLSRIRCPVLVIRPEGGWRFDESTMRARLACIPDATLKIVEGRHHVHLVTPELVAPQIRHFWGA